jgi:hypothetical protein
MKKWREFEGWIFLEAEDMRRGDHGSAARGRVPLSKYRDRRAGARARNRLATLAAADI